MPQSNPTRIMYRKDGGWYTWERHLTRQYVKGDNDRLYAVEFADGSVFNVDTGWQQGTSNE